MMKIKLKFFAAMFLIFVLSVADLTAQTRIAFARGKNSTVVSGVLGKRGAVDSAKKFVVRAKAGQHLSVVVKSANKSVYANMSGNEGERGADFYYTLDADGDYEFVVENVGARATKFTSIVSIE